MVDGITKHNEKIGSKVRDLSPEDRQKLVGVFAWLIQEDKKQNPELYKIKGIQNYD